MNKVFWLSAVFAVAVLAGCSSPSLPTSTNTPARQLTGSMDDWGAAVCKYGRYRQYSLIPVPTWMCSGNPGGGGFTTLLFIFEFRDQSEMRAHPEDWGHRYSYASCSSDDGRITVFVSDVSGVGSKGEAAQLTNESIQPLTRFGCTITQNDPYQSPSTPEQIPQPQPPPQPLPVSTNAMPPPTGMPPATTATAQPYWDGPWLRNYREDEQDCNSGGRYWVVQPGDGGMYALKIGCFPQSWIDALNGHCRSFGLPDGKCAVWDQDSIMSVFKKHGNLLIVALTQACLNRAGLSDFHEGPLHQDCVVHP
jgi:hypothetical protein